MTSKPVSEATFPKLNINGRARLTLLGTGAVFLLTIGFLLLLQSPAQAWTTKYGSCSANSCHGAAATATPVAVISVAINGSPGTTITVAPGSTFEVDWMYTNMKYSTNYTATAPEISLPTGWTLASGTANSPSLTGWSSAWDAADGVGWATAYSYDTSGEFPNSPVGYTINYNATSWDNGNRNSALDNAAAGDLDGAANKMGTDARITIPVGASPGSYTVMVMGVGHNENNTKAHIEQAITVTVSSGISQTITVGTPAPGSAAYNSQFTVAATATSGLPVTYSSGSTGICTNSGATFTMVSGTGTCIVQYDQDGGSGYNAAPRVTNNVTATKSNQATVTVSAPANATYGQTGLSASASGGSGTGAFSYSAGSSTACTVNSSTGGLTITSGSGTCSITATRATDSNYNVSAASAPATVTIGTATQVTLLVTGPASVTYGSTGSITTSGGSGTGGISYSHGASTGCTVNPSTGVISVTNASVTCSVTATKAADANYSQATSAGYSVTLIKLTPTLSVTNSPVTYDGSPKSAIVSGSVPGTASSVLTGGAVSQTSVGIYAVTANFDPTDSNNYNSLTAASAGNFEISTAAQATLAVTGPASVTYGSTGSMTTSGGSGTGAMSYSQGASTGCTVNPSTGVISVTNASGTCSVTATKAGDATYNPATSAAFAVTLNKAAQTTVTASAPANASYGQTGLSASAAGGSGSGAYSYSAGSSTACTVNPSTGGLTITSGTGSCSITATRATDSNYLVSGASAPATVTINKATPTVTAWPTASAIVYGQTLAESTLSGGAATPAGSFAFTVPTTAPNAGTAAQGVTYTPTDSTNYNMAVGTVSVTMDRANQTITFEALGNKIYGDGSFTLSATGGASGNPVTFISSNLAVATVSGTTVTIVGAGITTITASQTGSANYNAASDQFQALAVDKASQTITFAVLPSKNVGDADFAPGATADSTLPVTYISSNTAVATIVGGLIHVVGAGSADITASQAGNTNYNAAADVIQPLTVTAAGNPTLSVTITGNGSVNSNPSGISCTSGTCSSDVFTGGQLVVLTASTSWNYDFSSWTGPCTVNANLCTVSVNGLTEVIATFTAKQLVMLPGPTYYASMQDAYNSAAEGAVLQGRDQIFTENLVLDRSVNVTFNGGNNEVWTVAGNTTINGTVTMGGVAGGSVTISNLVIQ